MADTTNSSSKVPYLQSYGQIKRALDKIQKASTPPKFTQDFLATKLDMAGGSARPVIPFLKRAGFLSSDGTPTELYRQFKNPTLAGAAAAQALRTAYSSLYEVNEYVHEAKDKELKGIILQVTGLEDDSKLVASMLNSFKTLRGFASFGVDPREASEEDVDSDSLEKSLDESQEHQGQVRGNLQLGYTINLNLPETTNIAVFNAIFKSLREHLL